MSKLKAQTTAGTQTPEHAQITWPPLNLPEPDPRFGMTAAHQEYLQMHYSAVQGAVNARLAAMSAELETLKSQLKSPGK